jgi:uncharacterized protein YjbI with pentapeptide repeats
MANEEHVALLKQGVKVWNKWREKTPNIKPDLHKANLHKADLRGAILTEANLRGTILYEAFLNGANLPGAILSRADLRGAILHKANLSKAHLNGANLSRADLFRADLRGADLRGAILTEANLSKAILTETNLSGVDLSRVGLYEANLSEAILSRADLHGVDLSGVDLNMTNLSEANLSGANLTKADLTWAILTKADLSRAGLYEANLSEANLNGANLKYTVLIRTNLTNTNLTGCRIYGISAWDLNLENAKQESLIITDRDQAEITVDDLEVAQFIYLLLHNEKIRDVIDTIGKKAVLILGRFTPERKVVLDALREELRKRNYLPILFDFEKPTSRDLTQTVATLARLARFIIADVTDPRSIPHELAFVVPTTKVPVQPVMLLGETTYTMFDELRAWPWVLETYRYASLEQLIANLGERVIHPAENKALELRGKKPGTNGPVA